MIKGPQANYPQRPEVGSESNIYLRNRIADMVAGGRVNFAPISSWQVLDDEGRRKYVSAEERARFLAIMDNSPPSLKALGYVLVHSGCRISEALEVRAHQIDPEKGRIIVRTLKRRRTVFRAIPLPDHVIALLIALCPATDGRLWPIHRSTAFRKIKQAMERASIEGPMACCRGLRHGYGIHGASCQVPPNLITKWMGHASGSTTAIYLDAVGWEEREFAGRMW